jgi:hypothetical protein
LFKHKPLGDGVYILRASGYVDQACLSLDAEWDRPDDVAWCFEKDFIALAEEIK